MSIPREQTVEDPLLRSARREACLVFCIWLAALLYTIGYCYVFGYGRGSQPPTLWFGVPDWVLWGIVLPWTLCTAIAWWFGLWFMSDDELGDELEGEFSEGDPGQREAPHE